MCSRYYIDDEMVREIGQLVHQIDCRLQEERQGREVRPGDAAPILRGGYKGPECVWQKWGFPAVQKKGLIFNARSETVLEKKLFGEGVRKRRIAVPCTYFYEWNRAKEKVTFFRNDSSVVFLGGFYSQYEDEERFVIITTNANDSMKQTHDRMPLILEREEVSDWLFDAQKIEKILNHKQVMLNRKAEYEQQVLPLF